MAFSRTDPPSKPFDGPAPGQNNLNMYDLYIRISRPTPGWESEWEKWVTRDGTSPAINMLNKALMSHISTTTATALRFIQSDHDMIRNSKITSLGANDSATGAGMTSSHDPKWVSIRSGYTDTFRARTTRTRGTLRVTCMENTACRTPGHASLVGEGWTSFWACSGTRRSTYATRPRSRLGYQEARGPYLSGWNIAAPSRCSVTRKQAT